MKTRIILTSFLALGVCSASAQVYSETFDGVAKQTNGGAIASLGTGGDGFDYTDQYGTWIYNNGNMGIDNPPEGDGTGVGQGNAIDSTGMVRIQDWRGTNARIASVVIDGSIFTDGMSYDVYFDVIGDPEGNDAGRYWLAELSGFDDSGANYIQIDGTFNGFSSETNKPFTASGSAVVNYLADSPENGVFINGETDDGTTQIVFTFTYTAGTDIGFAVGTYRSLYGIDNLIIDNALPRWAGFEIMDGNYVDTGDFLGQLYVTDGDWVYSYDAEKWLLLPENFVGANGGWTYWLAR